MWFTVFVINLPSVYAEVGIDIDTRRHLWFRYGQFGILAIAI